MSIIGKIAKEIGEEVAEGMTKKAAPKVMPAVKKPLEWGFKGRKPTDIVDFNYRKDWDPGNLPIISQKEHDLIIDINMKKLKKGAEKNKYIKELIDDNKKYADEKALFEANKEFQYLETWNVPRELTGKMIGNKLGLNYSTGLWGQQDEAKKFADWRKGWLRYHNELTKSQKETFDSLSDEWYGSPNELVDAAKLL